MSAQPPCLPDIPGKVDIDPVEQVMHEFPYGIYIVGFVEDDEPKGMIADSRGFAPTASSPSTH